MTKMKSLNETVISKHFASLATLPLYDFPIPTIYLILVLKSEF